MVFISVRFRITLLVALAAISTASSASKIVGIMCVASLVSGYTGGGNGLGRHSKEPFHGTTAIQSVDDSSISRVVEILQPFAKPTVLLDYSLEVR
jgi:hypothetical protein